MQIIASCINLQTINSKFKKNLIISDVRHRKKDMYIKFLANSG